MKRVLIISYYWPPAGGPGIQRVLKFIKYLKKFDWEPIVLTVRNGDYPAEDKSLLKELPSDIKVFRTKTFELFHFYRKLSGKKSNERIPTFALNQNDNESLLTKFSKFVRSNFFVPDARKGWVPFLYKEGCRIIKKYKPQVILSSSPPHSLQLGAEKLAERFNIKWITDFRDPWSNAFWLSNLKRFKFAQTKDEKLERKILASADAVISLSPSILKNYKNKQKNNYFLIYNGYDEDDFTDIQRDSNDFLRITYSGSLAESQKIENFINSLEYLYEKKKKKFKFDFYGNIHNKHLLQLQDLIDKGFVEIHTYVEHKSLIKEIINSDILLLSIPDCEDNKGIVTGKIFEYIRTDNFILGIGPEDGDAADLIKYTESGLLFSYDSDITKFMESLYDKKMKGDSLKQSNKNIAEFSREYLTKKLVEVLNYVIED